VGTAILPQQHAADTIAAGTGLCVEPRSTSWSKDGVRYVHELVEWGARFDRDATARCRWAARARTAAGACCTPRMRPAARIGRALWERVAEQSRVRVERNARVHELIVRGGRCIGARFTKSRARRSARGGRAAGDRRRRPGVPETTNPPIATGDGVMLGWFAGARVTDLEFVQFHPTALDVPGAPRFLLSEALRGEGAELLNADGERFMTRYEAGRRAGLARPRLARDRARAAPHRGAGLPVDGATRSRWTRARFPTIAEACRSSASTGTRSDSRSARPRIT
jgi:L-aspartate oxidase